MCKPTHPGADDATAASLGADDAATAAAKQDATTTTTKTTRIIARSELAMRNSPSSAWCAIRATSGGGRRGGGSSSSSSGEVGGGGGDDDDTKNKKERDDDGDGRYIVLDVTRFATVHPGGDLILLGAGKDASVLFETYHPRGVPGALIEKLRIGTMEAGSFDGSFYSWNSDFYPTLKRRVVDRLAERGLDRRGSIEIRIKAALLLLGFWYSLFEMAYASRGDHFLVSAAWSISMGIFAALIGVNVQHDGNHGAFATSKFANKIAGWTMDMIGASAFTWEMQHMLGHHPYTNVLDAVEDDRRGKGVDCKMEEKDQESDPDVFSSFPLMRMHPLHTPSWFHKYQHLYAPFLFAVMTLAKVFQQDFEVATSKRLYHIDATVRYGSPWNVARFWIMKFVTMIYMLGLPMYFHGVRRGLSLFLFGHLACGELLATMFIVNHVIEGVSYGMKDPKECADGDDDGDDGRPSGDRGSGGKRVCKPTTMMGDTPMERTRMEAFETSARGGGDQKPPPSVPFNDWAAVQCQTSVNWAPGSWFWNHFSGGLSHQIEHHLFPSICHTNYVHIQDVVESTCAEYGVPYQSEPSLYVAYGKMINHLKFLGRGKVE